MLKDPEALENIVAASPGLDNDPTAMGKSMINFIIC